MVDLVSTFSIVSLISLVLIIIGAVLVGKTPTSPEKNSADERNRISGIVLLVVGCVAVVVSAVFIGYDTNKPRR